jgi:hypothetical protein
MTPQEKTEINALCTRIIEESDPAKFHQLVTELSELLDRTSRELRKPEPKNT